MLYFLLFVLKYYWISRLVAGFWYYPMVRLINELLPEFSTDISVIMLKS